MHYTIAHGCQQRLVFDENILGIDHRYGFGFRFVEICFVDSFWGASIRLYIAYNKSLIRILANNLGPKNYFKLKNIDRGSLIEIPLTNATGQK